MTGCKEIELGSGPWIFLGGRAAVLAARGAKSLWQSLKSAFEPPPAVSALERYLHRASEQMAAGEYEAALESFQRCTTERDGHDLGCFGMSFVFLLMGRITDAALYSNRIQNRGLRSHTKWAVLTAQQRHEEALGLCLELLDGPADNSQWLIDSRWLLNAGTSCLQLNRHKEALRHLEKARKLRHGSDHTEVDLLIACAFTGLGQERKALEMFDALHTAMPYSIDRLSWMSRAKAQLGDDVGARETLLPAIKMAEGAYVYPYGFKPEPRDGSPQMLERELAELRDVYKAYFAVRSILEMKTVKAIRFHNNEMVVFLRRSGQEDEVVRTLRGSSKLPLRIEITFFLLRRMSLTRAIWGSIAAAAAILIAVGMIAHALGSRSAPLESAQAPHLSIPTSVSPARQQIVDDDAAITSAVEREGYLLDGAIVDLEGMAGGPKLHVFRIGCTPSDAQCVPKLFVFSGSTAIWSEKVNPSPFNSPVSSNGPGIFSVAMMEGPSEGQETAIVATFVWDGATLTKHDEVDQQWYCGNHGCQDKGTSVDSLRTYGTTEAPHLLSVPDTQQPVGSRNQVQSPQIRVGNSTSDAIPVPPGDTIGSSAIPRERPSMAPRRPEEVSTPYWTDGATGLMWTRADNAYDVSWPQAVAYCSNLTLGQGFKWRLPTIEELEALNGGNRVIDGWQFSKAWSSSPGYNRGEAFYFDFVFGVKRNALGVNFVYFRAVCVRSSYGS